MAIGLLRLNRATAMEMAVMRGSLGARRVGAVGARIGSWSRPMRIGRGLMRSVR